MQNHDSELTAIENEETAAAIAAEENEGAPNPEAIHSVSLDPVTRDEFEQLKTERDQLLDRLARMQAEFENARKRTERERVEFRDYAMGSVVEQFLPVVDNFELALKSTGTAEQLRTGVELIVKQMDEVLRQMQVVPVATIGEPFDPRHHEAMGTVERDDLPDHSVAEEVRKGYRLRERLLRPALVRISSNSKQTVA